MKSPACRNVLQKSSRHGYIENYVMQGHVGRCLAELLFPLPVGTLVKKRSRVILGRVIILRLDFILIVADHLSILNFVLTHESS